MGEVVGVGYGRGGGCGVWERWWVWGMGEVVGVGYGRGGGGGVRERCGRGEEEVVGGGVRDEARIHTGMVMG